MKLRIGFLLLALVGCVNRPASPDFPLTGSDLALKSGYSYKILISEGQPLSDGHSFAANNDMLAFVVTPKQTYLAINHENRPGGMSVLELAYKANAWEITAGKQIDFSAVGGTWANCAGAATPWGTVLSSEEFPPSSASEIPAGGGSTDPLNYGWVVEVNPETGKAVKQKALGRFSHEGIAVMPDQKTLYMGDDFRGGVLFRFVADHAQDLSSGTLYALDKPGKRWLEIPKTSLETARETAIALGATPFNRLEDIEYNPVDGQIYVSETGDNLKTGNDQFGRVWKLNPQTLELSVFAQGSLDGIVQPDNLAIEPNTGRVWIHEDRYPQFLAPTANMPNNSLWVASLDGQYQRFARMPQGSEVSGGTFAPDGSLFFAIMHPDAPWKSSVVQVLRK